MSGIRAAYAGLLGLYSPTQAGLCVQLELSTTKRGRGSSEHMEANAACRVMPRPRAPGSLSLSHTLYELEGRG